MNHTDQRGEQTLLDRDRMRADPVLEELWNSAPVSTATFDAALVAHHPAPVRRYLEHVFAPAARLSTTARISMHGTIKLGENWRSFEAEQVLRWDRGFVWQARAQVLGLPVTGFDRWLDGEGVMRWKLLGLVPVMTAEGPDISRSAAGRLQLEASLLPAVLLDPSIAWTVVDESHVGARIHAHGEDTLLQLDLTPEGALRSVLGERWGNPGGKVFQEQTFGGYLSGERSFDGVTIPCELRMGWWFGTDRFEQEGEFFRASIEQIRWR